jgi:hypothetical protein
LPALEHHTNSEDDVEEGGIKIKKKKYKFIFIPSRLFWMSEGSLN